MPISVLWLRQAITHAHESVGPDAARRAAARAGAVPATGRAERAIELAMQAA
jgi:hypothetical protein